MGRYTDEQLQAAIDAMRAGGDLLPEELLPELTDSQVDRYFAALDREEFALMCRWRKAWLEGDRGMPHPPFPVFRFVPEEIPDFPYELVVPDFPPSELSDPDVGA